MSLYRKQQHLTRMVECADNARLAFPVVLVLEVAGIVDIGAGHAGAGAGRGGGGDMARDEVAYEGQGSVGEIRVAVLPEPETHLLIYGRCQGGPDCRSPF